MKSRHIFRTKEILLFTVIALLSFGIKAQNSDVKEIKGTVVNERTGKKLSLVSIQLENSNISTVSNADGEFIIKLPDNVQQSSLIASLLGFQNKRIALSNISTSDLKISLLPSSINLNEVKITSFKNAEDLIKAVFDKKQENYSNDRTIMTSFYRETIKKRRKNVSLSEAVVNLYKQPYTKGSRDFMKLLKSRKSTDYTQLDTIALKLQGGPYNTLYVDVMKYPEYIFTPATLSNYDFSFDNPTEINGNGVYIVSFKQKEYIRDPLYFGKLYISSNTFALVRAEYSLNVSDKVEAGKLFVQRKPASVNVEPQIINYRVDYRKKGNKWYYSYSNASLTFKIKKRRRLFNSTYSLSCEMAITDWHNSTSDTEWSRIGDINKSIILTDEASGFSDPEFWGDYNVIEPEKSIESAINKIRRKLDKIGERGITGQ